MCVHMDGWMCITCLCLHVHMCTCIFYCIPVCIIYVAVEVRNRTLYRKLILRKWRPKFLNDFDVIIDVVLDCLV